VSEKGLWTAIVLAALAFAGVLAWRRGVFTRLFPPPATPKGGYPQPFAGGVAPTEISDNRSTYQKACSAIYQTGGKVAMTAPDPRAQAAGMVAQVGGPAICAGQEWVARQAASGVKQVAGGVAGLASSSGRAVSSFVGGLFS
jgi:hypothetical protein